MCAVKEEVQQCLQLSLRESSSLWAASSACVSLFATVRLAHGQQFLCLCAVVYIVRSVCVGKNIFPVLLRCNGNVIWWGADNGPIQTYLKSYWDMFLVFYLIRWTGAVQEFKYLKNALNMYQPIYGRKSTEL